MSAGVKRDNGGYRERPSQLGVPPLGGEPLPLYHLSRSKYNAGIKLPWHVYTVAAGAGYWPRRTCRGAWVRWGAVGSQREGEKEAGIAMWIVCHVTRGTICERQMGAYGILRMSS